MNPVTPYTIRRPAVDTRTLRCALAVALLCATTLAVAADDPAVDVASTPSPVTTQGRDGGPGGAFTYSSDPAIEGLQRGAKKVIEQYQAGLAAGDAAALKALFTPDAVLEANGVATLLGADAVEAGLKQMFQKNKYSTVFLVDAVDIYGDIAIVRTHHPVGQTIANITTGEKTLDFNREVFVLRKLPAGWRIVLYTFNQQPRQGEQ